VFGHSARQIIANGASNVKAAVGTTKHVNKCTHKV